MPVPGFVTDQEIQDQVRAVLSLDNMDQASGWPRICRAANRSAYGMILGALMRRGFSQAQADGWDRGEEFQTDLALWVAIVRGGLAKDYDPKYLTLFDRRDELKDAFVTAGGVAVTPATPRVAVGQMANCGDMFSLSDRDMWDWWWARSQNAAPPPVDWPNRSYLGEWPGTDNINEST
jgi:hypothetical protein